MAQLVSNDALWGKLSEVDEKLEQLITAQKSAPLQENNSEISLDLEELKEEIITEIRAKTELLGKHADKNFETVNKNIDTMNKLFDKVGRVLDQIRERQKSEPAEPQKGKDTHFNFWLFKVRKSSLLIASLSLLVLILILFGMKQQNDYSLLNRAFYRQSIVLREVQAEVDSLKNTNIKPSAGKRK